MYCPMSSLLNLAYLYKYYPQNFEYMLSKMKESEKKVSEKYGRPFVIRGKNPKYNANYVENIVKTRWLKKLEEIDKQSEQLNLFDKLRNDGGDNDN